MCHFGQLPYLLFFVQTVQTTRLHKNASTLMTISIASIDILNFSGSVGRRPLFGGGLSGFARDERARLRFYEHRFSCTFEETVKTRRSKHRNRTIRALSDDSRLPIAMLRTRCGVLSPDLRAEAREKLAKRSGIVGCRISARPTTPRTRSRWVD